MQALLESTGQHTQDGIPMTRVDMLSQIQSVAHTRPAVWRQLGLEVHQHALPNTTSRGVEVVNSIFVKYRATSG